MESFLSGTEGCERKQNVVKQTSQFSPVYKFEQLFKSIHSMSKCQFSSKFTEIQ